MPRPRLRLDMHFSQKHKLLDMWMSLSFPLHHMWEGEEGAEENGSFAVAERKGKLLHGSRGEDKDNPD